MPEKSWGLFGGKWEVKTDFRGQCGQINDPNDQPISMRDIREIVAFSRFAKNPPARTGSQEVASSILASSTNKINNLQTFPNPKKVTNR